MLLSDFDGEKLLTPSPPGTPYTDLLLSRFRAAGAEVTPVEAKVTGGGVLLNGLVQAGAITAMPADTPAPAGVSARGRGLHAAFADPLVGRATACLGRRHPRRHGLGPAARFLAEGTGKRAFVERLGVLSCSREP